MNVYEYTRQKYLPNKTRVLFVAEAPPENAERFFYYENVKGHDALFVNLMRALYEDYRHARITVIRKDKQKLLKRFRDDGFYLIDALPEPVSLRLSSREREKLISARAGDIVKQIKKLHPTNGTILIKNAVFHSLYEKLSQAGLAVKNHVAVPFPSSGHQSQRGDRRLTEWEIARIKYHYDTGVASPGFGYIIDNSDMTLDETVDKIIEIVTAHQHKV